MSSLPKHQKYAAAYRPGELFWGFGVEHETYLESAEFQAVRKEDLAAYRRPERYSVNYYKSYKEEDLVEALSSLPAVVAEVPTLVNSHSFTHCDVWMNHRTTYERVPKANPRFGGRSVHEDFLAASPWFRQAYDQSVVYDGDTFEFMNVNFYNVSVEEALEELWETEDKFLWEFNHWIMAKSEESTIGNEACKGRMTATTNGMSSIGMVNVANPLVQHLSTYGPFCIARRNHAWARHLTNPHHYSMFNNGTVHVNLTLPTRLDASGAIADMEDFRRRHQRAARYFQWFEPLLAVAYGAGDPFASYVDEGSRFSPVSQRLAVSRYVGMCNYPTEAMPDGKILTYDVSRGVGYSSPGVATSHVGFDSEPAWYEEFYKRTAYVRLENHGLDINYKKHWNHGLEFRIFDGLRRDQMLEVCKFVWKVCYRSQELEAVASPRGEVADCRHVAWFQELVLGCMLEGPDYVLSWGMLVRYLEAVGYVELLAEFPGTEKEGVRVGEFVGKIIAPAALKLN
jgi:hypothetical protein